MSIFTKISTWWKNRGKNENEPEVYLGVTPEEYKKRVRIPRQQKQ